MQGLPSGQRPGAGPHRHPPRRGRLGPGADRQPPHRRGPHRKKRCRAAGKAGGHLQLHRRGLPREAAAHHPGHRGVCPDRGPGRRAGRARAPGEL